MEEKSNFRKIFLLVAVSVAFVLIVFIGTKILVKTQQDSCLRNIKTFQTALEDYYNSHNEYPVELNLERLTYLKVIPKDSATGKPYKYKLSEDKQHYTISCPNPKNHKVKSIEGSDSKPAKIIYK